MEQLEIVKVKSLKPLEKNNPYLQEVNAYFQGGNIGAFKVLFFRDWSNFDIMHPEVNNQIFGEENHGKIWDYYEGSKKTATRTGCSPVL